MGRFVPAVLFLGALVCLGFLLFGCQQTPAGGGDMKPPHVAQPRFTGPREGWPPTFAGATGVHTVKLGVPSPNHLTDAWRRRIYDALPKIPSVSAALGRRFALTAIEEVVDVKDDDSGLHRCHCHESVDAGQPPHRCGHDCTPARCRCRHAEPAPLVDVEYFSYTFDAGVVVRARGLEVLGLEFIPGATPQIGPDERVRSVDLALRDPRVAKFVRSLEGGKFEAGAMLVVPRSDQPGLGHRVVYVTLGTMFADDPLLGVDVDLTDGKVLAVGPANGGQTG